MKKGLGPLVLIIVIPIVLIVEGIVVSTVFKKENLEQRQLLEASLISKSDTVETYVRSFLRATDISSVQGLDAFGTGQIVLPYDFGSTYNRISNLSYWQIYDTKLIPPKEVLLNKVRQKTAWVAGCYLENYMDSYDSFSQEVKIDGTPRLTVDYITDNVILVKLSDDVTDLSASLSGEFGWGGKKSEIDIQRNFRPYSLIDTDFGKIVGKAESIIYDDTLGKLVRNETPVYYHDMSSRAITQDELDKLANDLSEPEMKVILKIPGTNYEYAAGTAAAIINVTIYDDSTNYTFYDFPTDRVVVRYLGLNFLAKVGVSGLIGNMDEEEVQNLPEFKSCPSDLGIISPKNDICDFFTVTPTSCYKLKPAEVYYTLSSKPTLQEFRKEPDVMLGVVADRAYSMSEQGYSWKDSVSGIEYSNVYELFRDKGVDWTRTMLFWNETEGEYNLDYATNTLNSVNDAGLNILAVLGLSDGWGALDKQPGPTCVNYNQITVNSRYTGPPAPGNPCLRYDSLTWEEKKSIIEEYAGNVSKYFIDNGLDVKVYEIGNEIDYGIAGNYSDGHDKNVTWYKENIWPYEAEIIKSAIKGIRDSGSDAEIQIHISDWFDDTWIYEFFKFMLDQGIEINYTALSYGAYGVPEGEWHDTAADINFLLNNIDKVQQRLLNDGYDVKFIIAEFSYPSSSDLPQWFIDNDWDNPVDGYPLTPEGQANWLRDFYDAIYTNDNITGSFWLWPEAADGFWTDFSSVFYYGEYTTGPDYTTYESCNDFTGSYDDMCFDLNNDGQDETLYEYDCYTTSEICYYMKYNCPSNNCTEGACTILCSGDPDCDDGNICTGVETEGGIDKCRNPGLENASCDRPNLPSTYVPPGDACGTTPRLCGETGDCTQNCQAVGNTWMCDGPPNKECPNTCDGFGGCDGCTPPTCDQEDCGCADDTYCSPGYKCKLSTNECTLDECDSDSDCTDPKTDCQYWTCDRPTDPDSDCVLNNWFNGYIPPGNTCGEDERSCLGECKDIKFEYRDPVGDTVKCARECDGSGGCKASCTPPACSYTSIRECLYGCKDGMDCWQGYFCPPKTCGDTCCGPCTGTSCTTWEGCVREDMPMTQTCTWQDRWDNLGCIIFGCGPGEWCEWPCCVTDRTCTETCTYSDVCTYI